MDIMDHFVDLDKYPHLQGWEDTDNNLISVQTRSLLTSASNVDPQPRIWQKSYNCSLTLQSEGSGLLPDVCEIGGATFGVLSLLEEPYLAQLPTGYSKSWPGVNHTEDLQDISFLDTGVVRQFIPRFNISISRENITEQGMPKECNVDQPGAFYVNYANEVKDGNRTEGDWAMEACMPANQQRSPWQATRSRQDFTETLYLKLRSDPHSIDFPGVPVRSAQDCTFKITLNTTAGYFEFVSTAESIPSLIKELR